MKKVISLLAVSALVTSLGTASVYAASDSQNNRFIYTGSCGAICESAAENTDTARGICRKAGRPSAERHAYCGRGGNNGSAADYVDENNDGVCDNCINDGACPQDGTGAQTRQRNGRNR